MCDSNLLMLDSVDGFPCVVKCSMHIGNPLTRRGLSPTRVICKQLQSIKAKTSLISSPSSRNLAVIVSLDSSKIPLSRSGESEAKAKKSKGEGNEARRMLAAKGKENFYFTSDDEAASVAASGTRLKAGFLNQSNETVFIQLLPHWF